MPRRNLVEMDNCCQDKSLEMDRLRERQSKILWIVLVINLSMFALEVTGGLLAGSTALLADSLDMLGDALVYGFSLYVVGRSDRWKASAALIKGVVMAGFGAMVLLQVGISLLFPELPDFRMMGIIGIVALVANGICLFLLTRHRGDDLNMRSTWLCSRNDIIANVGLVAAAAGVFVFGSPLPDLVVALVVTAVFIKSSVYIIQQAVTTLRSTEYHEKPVEPRQSIGLLLSSCPARTCTANACRCKAI